MVWDRGPALRKARAWFVLCCHRLEILSNFTFELVLCEWSPMGQWSMCRSRGDLHRHPPRSLASLLSQSCSSPPSVSGAHLQGKRISVCGRGSGH